MQLFDEFPSISTEEWMNKIETDLKGADFQKKLVWKSPEGIAIRPFYRDEDLEDLAYQEGLSSLRPGEGKGNSWNICQDIYPGLNGSDESVKGIRAALKGGAQAIRILLADVGRVDEELILGLLDEVDPAETQVIFHGYLGADTLLEHLKTHAARKGTGLKDVKACLGADPLCKMIITGIHVASFSTLGRLVKECSEEAPGIRVISVNGARFQDSGSNMVQEMAFTLAMANEYLSILSEQGLDPAMVVKSMQLNMATGPDYFMEIAKIRAMRVLWAAIAGAYGLKAGDAPITIHSGSSEWNQTMYDPHVNTLRATTGAMSAVLGGADLISVLPYDHAFGKSTEFSERIARNIQIILRDESYLGRVSDPSAGSYYIEKLTDELSEKAWELFRETENLGGFRKAFQSGWIQKQVEASRQNRLEKIASGREHLLGTNAFPNFTETMDPQPEAKKDNNVLKASFPTLKPFRASSVFEDLRLETENSSKRPKVFLFKHGNPVWVTARAAFSGNFFACAGYEIIDPAAFASVEEGLEAAGKADPDVIVLCSADDAYPEMAPIVNRALGDKAILVLAGKPAEKLEELKNAGVKHFIHIRSNLLETLKEFNAQLL